MPRGGFRPGAGRKPKAPVETKPNGHTGVDGFKTEDAPPGWPFGQDKPATEPSGDLSPLDFLLKVMRDENEDKGRRMQAAIQAAPYLHAKKGEAGKKEQKQKAAEKVAGRFSASEPPKLVAAGGKRV